MTWFGARRPPMREPMDERDAAEAGMSEVAAGPDAAHRRAVLLSEVAAEGPVGLFRVLRRAVSGDADAAGIRVSALLRALPGITMLDCHDLLLRSRIHEPAVAGDLSPGQRVALVSLVDRIRPYEERARPRPRRL